MDLVFSKSTINCNMNLMKHKKTRAISALNLMEFTEFSEYHYSFDSNLKNKCC